MSLVNLQWFLRPMLVIVLLLAVWQSSLVLIAGTMNRQLEEIITDNLSITDMDLATRQLSRFSFIENEHPRSLYLAYLTSMDPAVRLAKLEKLTELRPGSAIAHAFVFSEQLASGKVDKLSLEKAVTLGKWEPDVLDLIVKQGTRYWLRLGQAEKQIIIESAGRRLVHSSRWHRDSTLRLLKARGFLTMVCASMNDDAIPACENG